MNERVNYESCPLCQSADFSLCAQGDCSGHAIYDARLSAIIRWMECAACGHIFTEGYFTDEACGILFSKTNAIQQLGADYEKYRLVASRMIDRVLPYVRDGVWLDIGIGNGALLFTAQEYGFEPIGTDLRADNISILSSFGIEAHATDITELHLSSECSVISMADVLEHMAFPKLGLAAANRLLRDEGVLLISMPNKDSMLWKMLNGSGANPYWGEIEHYHNFGRARLFSLLKEFGFEPRRYGSSERYRACMEIVAQKVRAI